MPNKYDLNGKLIDYKAIDTAANDAANGGPIKYDLSGKVIGPSAQDVAKTNPVIDTTNKVVSTLAGAPSSTPSGDADWADLIPAAATFASSFIPGGVGTRIIAPALAATGGSLLRDTIKKGPSNLDLGDFENAVGSGAMAGGVGAVSEALPALWRSGKSTLRDYLFNKSNTKALAAAGMLEGTRAANAAGGYRTPTGAETLEQKIAPIKLDEGQAWDTVRNNARNNTITYQVPGPPSTVLMPNGQPSPTMQNVNIEGPIKVSGEVQNFISSIGQEVEQMYPNMPDYMKAKYAPLMSTMKRIQAAGIKLQNGDQYIPFDLAKELRTNIGAINAKEADATLASSVRSVGKSRQGALMDQFRDALTSDITNTMAHEWGSPTAAQDFGKAVGLTKTRVKADLFDKAIANRTNMGNGQLDIHGLIDDINNPTSPLQGEFTAQERSNITNAFRAIQGVSPDYGGSFTYDNGAFILRNAYNGLRHPINVGVAASARDIFEGIISNPKYARILATMPSLPPNSAQAGMLTKTMLGLLKGASVYITQGDVKIPAHIDQNGKPIPDFQQMK